MESKTMVLVAGATGYIGGHITRVLHDAGYRACAPWPAARGVGLSAMFVAAEDPLTDVVYLVDDGLAQLEAGFPT